MACPVIVARNGDASRGGFKPPQAARIKSPRGGHERAQWCMQLARGASPEMRVGWPLGVGLNHPGHFYFRNWDTFIFLFYEWRASLTDPEDQSLCQWLGLPLASRRCPTMLIHSNRRVRRVETSMNRLWDRASRSMAHVASARERSRDFIAWCAHSLPWCKSSVARLKVSIIPSATPTARSSAPISRAKAGKALTPSAAVGELSEGRTCWQM